jgi:hypothetical protein
MQYSYYNLIFIEIKHKIIKRQKTQGSIKTKMRGQSEYGFLGNLRRNKD